MLLLLETQLYLIFIKYYITHREVQIVHTTLQKNILSLFIRKHIFLHVNFIE